MKKEDEKKPKKQIIAEKYLHLVSDSVETTPEARGFSTCPCPKTCTIKGDCRLCTAYHARKGKLPRCER